MDAEPVFLRTPGVVPTREIRELLLRLNAAGLIDHSLYLVDGTNVRASRAAAGAAGGKTRSR